jgi:hypothetical protein
MAFWTKSTAILTKQFLPVKVFTFHCISDAIAERVNDSQFLALNCLPRAAVCA